MTRMTRTLVLIAVVAGLAVAGCGSRPAPLPNPTPPRTRPPNPAPTSPPTAPPSAGVRACDLAAQEAAMRPDQVPDWEALDLPACYELTLDLEPEMGSYTGDVQVTFTNPHDAALAELVFRTYPNAQVIYGGELVVTRAEVDGQPIRPNVFLPDRTALRLTLPEPLAPGATAVVQMAFEGRFPIDFGGLEGIYGIFNYVSQDQVLTLADSYPILAVFEEGDWQVAPVSSIGDAVVSQIALYQVQVSAPRGWHVVATGSQVGASNAGDREQWSFVSGPVREFIVVTSPSFVLREDQVDGITVHHWGLPEGEPRWEEALQATLDSMALFNRRFGEYPYAELDVVDVPMENAAGVEYPGLFIVGSSMYASDEQRSFLLGIVVSHEAAHQWWYGVVGNDVLEDPWQDEALAVFSSLLYQETYQPRVYAGTLEFYQSSVDSLAEEPGNMGIDQSVQAFESRRQFYGPVVYQKGGVFYAELREKIGDEALFAALQAYYADNQYQLAAPETLLASFETACRCELDEFYRTWGVNP